MKIIVGSVGAGKTFILAEEALKSSKENRVLIFVSDPKDMFSKLGMVSGSDQVTCITVIKVTEIREIIRYLLAHSNSFDKVYVDVDGTYSNAEFSKLEGFAIGSRLDLTVTWNTNMDGTKGKVSLYDQADSKMILLEEYSKQDIEEKVKGWS